MALLAACASQAEPRTQAGGSEALAVKRNLQSADCGDWKRLSPAERKEVIVHLEDAVAGSRKEGRTLPRDAAYRIFEGRCREYAARGFLLYEMYTRAASFYGFTEGD